MGYQALLFCPDDKTARTVAQILGEMDFIVTTCTEPFAAVKQLMAERFDAVVIDCDNEQNATLLFKSARNTPNNQSALAIAVVEGQAGVAKAFRIGANLVLTKPINVEQAKGTVRVARGLLRKNEGSKPSTSASATAKQTPAQAPVNPVALPAISVEKTPGPVPVVPKVTLSPASIPAQKFTPPPGIAASIPEAKSDSVEVSEPASKTIAASPVGQRTESSTPKLVSPVTTSAASAPAPAREPKPAVSNEGRSPLFVDASSPAGPVADSKEKIQSSDAAAVTAPTLTFGGTVGSGVEPSAGGSKKAFLAVAAVVVIAAGGYGAWMHWGHPSEAAGPSAGVRAPASTAIKAAPAVVLEPKPSSSSNPSTSDATVAVEQTEVLKPSSNTLTSATGAKAPVHSGKDSTGKDSAKPSATVATTKAPATDEDVQPIVIKNQSAKSEAKAALSTEAPALSITNIASASSAAPLSDLMGSSKAATPVLQRLSVSQGVSRGLLVKQVQPGYPPSAMRMRIEGTVQLLATLSKNGDITAIKILSGDKQLAQAAVTAVKQWKYKPYLLNGEPVEIQTEVTVNFKLPR